MRQSLYEFCVENKRTELLSEWDDCANMPLTPKTVSYGSKQKAHPRRSQSEMELPRTE